MGGHTRHELVFWFLSVTGKSFSEKTFRSL